MVLLCRADLSVFNKVYLLVMRRMSCWLSESRGCPSCSICRSSGLKCPSGSCLQGSAPRTYTGRLWYLKGGWGLVGSLEVIGGMPLKGLGTLAPSSLSLLLSENKLCGSSHWHMFLPCHAASSQAQNQHGQPIPAAKQKMSLWHNPSLIEEVFFEPGNPGHPGTQKGGCILYHKLPYKVQVCLTQARIILWQCFTCLWTQG